MVSSNTPKTLNLEQFRGAIDRYYRHPLTGYSCTEGAKYVAEKAGSWLLDTIFSAQHVIGQALEESQVWVLLVSKAKRARLICHDGNGRRLYSVRIPQTDFPARRLTLCFDNSYEGRCLYLPEEF